MKLYEQWMESCRQADLPAISTDTAARLMAVLHEYGNNEGFTHDKKFLADVKYIQKRFDLQAMGPPDPEFRRLLRHYLKELQDYQAAHKDDAPDPSNPLAPLAPEWAPRLLKERYNMKFIG